MRIKSQFFLIVTGIVLAVMLCATTAAGFATTRTLEVKFVPADPFVVAPDGPQSIEVPCPGSATYVWTVIGTSEGTCRVAVEYVIDPVDAEGVMVDVSPQQFDVTGGGLQEVTVAVTADGIPCNINQGALSIELIFREV